jgi:hypothetical protein
LKDLKLSTSYCRPRFSKKQHYFRIEEYDRFYHPLQNDDIGLSAQRLCGKYLLSTQKIAPLSSRQAKKALQPNTSPGLPYVRQGYKTKRDATTQCMRDFTQIKALLCKEGGWKEVKTFPCYAVARCALTTDATKPARLAWGYPMMITYLEAHFAPALMDALRDLDLFSWDINYLDNSSFDLWRGFTAGSSEQFRAYLDWSGFDAHVSRDQIEWAFGLLWSLLDFSDIPRKLRMFYKQAWLLIKDYFIYTYIIIGKRLYVKSSGIPSGSYFTQMIGSIINYLVITDTLMVMANRTFDNHHSLFPYIKILGDDSLLRADLRLLHEPDLLAEIALMRHGMELSIEKSGLSFRHDPEETFSFDFLGKTLTSDISVLVPIEKVTAQALIPEKADSCPGDVLTRLMCLAWMSGTSYENYDFLKTCYEYVESKYQCEPAPVSWNLKGVLSGMSIPAPTCFPNRQEVLTRYTTSRYRNNVFGTQLEVRIGAGSLIIIRKST